MLCIYIYIHLVDRLGTRGGFQSSRLQAELIPKKIRKFGKREPQMKLAVAGSYVQAEGSELLAGPLETRSRGSIVAELLNKIYDGIRYNEITSDMRGPSRFSLIPLDCVQPRLLTHSSSVRSISCTRKIRRISCWNEATAFKLMIESAAK